MSTRSNQVLDFKYEKILIFFISIPFENIIFVRIFRIQKDEKISNAIIFLSFFPTNTEPNDSRESGVDEKKIEFEHFELDFCSLATQWISGAALTQ